MNWKTLTLAVLTWWAMTACMTYEFEDEAEGEDALCDSEEESEEVTEVCGNKWDDDGDTLVDEDECVPAEDAATDTVADTTEDTASDVPLDDAGTDPDVAEDTSPDTLPDTTPDSAPDVPTDTGADDTSSEPELPGPEPPLGSLYATYRDWVTNPADAVETRLYGDLTGSTFSTLPGRPSAICAFGSWNAWSYSDGKICKYWSETGVPGSAWYHRGGDTSFFFTLGGTNYDVDLSRFDFVDPEPCYRAATSVGGVTRYVLRCPAIPELDICDDGLDNDHDGLVDIDDPDCDTFWEPPSTSDHVNRLSGVAIGDCVNFSGTFWFDATDGYGLVRPLGEGEYVSRVTAYHDALSGCDASPCFSINYRPSTHESGDGNPVNFTLCGFSEVRPAVITSWGATLRMDVSSLVLGGDLCRTAGNTAITAWGIGSCGGSGGTTPPPTGTEVCDGYDNDGDGLVDETFTCPSGSSRACTTSCGSTGTQDCGSSCSWGLCIPPAETCNGRDDNCDGLVDEGGVCGGGGTEVCDGVDNDGDTLVDEGGVCGSGGIEVCDGVDNDGDGAIDEDGVCGSGTVTDRYRITATVYDEYVELAIVAHFDDSWSRVLTSNPRALHEGEDVGSICATYCDRDPSQPHGCADWNDQIWDPYWYHTDSSFDPCRIYAGDGSTNTLRLPIRPEHSGTLVFMLFAVGEEVTTPRHRVWFNVGEWMLSRMRVNSDVVYEVDISGRPGAWSGGTTTGGDEYFVEGLDHGSYREIQISGPINANRDTALAHTSERWFAEGEEIAQICVAYGHVDWSLQMIDPWIHRSSTEHDPCVVYDGDGTTVSLTVPTTTYVFLPYFIGTMDHRVWLNVDDPQWQWASESGYEWTSVEVTSDRILAFTF